MCCLCVLTIILDKSPKEMQTSWNNQIDILVLISSINWYLVIDILVLPSFVHPLFAQKNFISKLLFLIYSWHSQAAILPSCTLYLFQHTTYISLLHGFRTLPFIEYTRGNIFTFVQPFSFSSTNCFWSAMVIFLSPSLTEKDPTY
jgi:hypothetical protein